MLQWVGVWWFSWRGWRRRRPSAACWETCATVWTTEAPRRRCSSTQVWPHTSLILFFFLFILLPVFILSPFFFSHLPSFFLYLFSHSPFYFSLLTSAFCSFLSLIVSPLFSIPSFYLLLFPYFQSFDFLFFVLFHSSKYFLPFFLSLTHFFSFFLFTCFLFGFPSSLLIFLSLLCCLSKPSQSKQYSTNL